MIENGTIAGDLRVDGDYTLNGIAQGEVRVTSAGRLLLRGIAQGPIFVEAGGELDLRGIAQSGVVSEGSAEVRGIVQGALRSSGGGTAVARRGSYVAGAEQLNDTAY